MARTSEAGLAAGVGVAGQGCVQPAGRAAGGVASRAAAGQHPGGVPHRAGRRRALDVDPAGGGGVLRDRGGAAAAATRSASWGGGCWRALLTGDAATFALLATSLALRLRAAGCPRRRCGPGWRCRCGCPSAIETGSTGWRWRCCPGPSWSASGWRPRRPARCRRGGCRRGCWSGRPARRPAGPMDGDDARHADAVRPAHGPRRLAAAAGRSRIAGVAARGHRARGSAGGDRQGPPPRRSSGPVVEHWARRNGGGRPPRWGPAWRPRRPRRWPAARSCWSRAICCAGIRGVAAALIFGLSRAATLEPEAVEALLPLLLEVGRLEAIEAFVDLLAEHPGWRFGGAGHHRGARPAAGGGAVDRGTMGWRRCGGCWTASCRRWAAGGARRCASTSSPRRWRSSRAATCARTSRRRWSPPGEPGPAGAVARAHRPDDGRRTGGPAAGFRFCASWTAACWNPACWPIC